MTLATNGTSWIRVDGRYDDPNGIDDYGNRLVPIAQKGAVLSGWNPEQILVPTR